MSGLFFSHPRCTGNGRDEGRGGRLERDRSPPRAAPSRAEDPGVDKGSYEDDGSYADDDDEWEEDEESDGATSGGDGAHHREARGGGARELGASELEVSFRESFASVNGILSSIAGGTSSDARAVSLSFGKCSGCSVRSSDRDGGGGSASSSRNLGDSGTRGTDSLDSSPSVFQAAGRYVGGLSSSPGSSISPRPSRSRAAQSHGTATGNGGSERGSSCGAGEGGGASRTTVPLSPGEEGESRAAVTAAEIGGGVGEEQMPAEMSGMLQRYSEMMLRVVQVGYAYPSDGRERLIALTLLFLRGTG